MNCLLFSVLMWALPVGVWAQAVPPAMPAPTTNLPPPMPAPTTNLPPPMPAPNPLVVPVAPMYLNASQTFISRGSIATYFDSAGTLQTAPANTPRYDYDPVTHVAKGILVEPRRMNYVENSENLNVSTWRGYYGKPVVTSATDPQGFTAFKLTTNNFNGNFSGVYAENKLAPRTGNFSLSFRAKFSILPSSVSIGIGDGGARVGKLEIYRDNVLVEMSASGGNTVNMTSAISDTGWHGWKVIVYDVKSRGMNRIFQLWENDVNPFEIEISRIQTEWGSDVTSYIPTSGSPVTRAQDVYQQF